MDVSVGTHRNSRPAAVARVGRLPLRRRMTLYVLSGGVWLTGVVWLILHYFVPTEDELGFVGANPMEKWSLMVHSGFALGAVWIFGVLWPNHVKKGWNSAARRPTGGAIFGVTAVLAVSGSALYYIGSDTWRGWISLLHWIVGLAGLAVFLLHLLTRRTS